MFRVRRRIKSIGRQLLSQPDPIILMYHRVADAVIDPWGLAVHPDNFAAQMRVLKQTRQPVPLDWMVEQLLVGKRPKGMVAITFDDAYRDVLRNAKPVLVELDMPATVFVVTGLLGSEQGFWWDRLASAVFGGSDQAGGLNFSFLERDDQHDIDRFHAGGDKDALHLKLWNRIRVLAPGPREQAVDEVAAALGPHSADDAPVMTIEDIRELIDGGLISVGAHTVSHPSLPSLSTEGQHAEIAQSRQTIEALIDQPVRRLAYPFGDYDERSQKIACDLGFDYAVSVEAGAVVDPAARFRLPRHDIKNWSGAEFGKRLRWFN
jgi:peptidoglycan/xylan/chitin deacetylase (PgdA/CDA1 family)